MLFELVVGGGGGGGERQLHDTGWVRELRFLFSFMARVHLPSSWKSAVWFDGVFTSWSFYIMCQQMVLIIYGSWTE